MYKFTIKDDRLDITPKDELYDYVRIRHGRHSTNTQRRYAQAIRKFIGDKPIKELDEEYTLEYIRARASSGINKNTHDFEIYAIKDFLRFLSKRNIIVPVNEMAFVGVRTAPERPTEKINDIKPKYLKLFLETAFYFQPRIAFLVLLCIAGGLRPSEALNLSKSSITSIGPWGKDGWIVEVKNRPLREHFAPSCKRPRRQRVQSMGDVGARLYKIHMERYVTDDSSALFPDENGNAMTYDAFYRRFRRIREHFIDALKTSLYPEDIAYGNFLETRRWGGDIGRSIFSSYIACNTSNVTEIARDKGGMSPALSLPYLHTAKP